MGYKSIDGSISSRCQWFRNAIASTLLVGCVTLRPSSFAADGDWPHYARGGASSKYSPLQLV